MGGKRSKQEGVKKSLDIYAFIRAKLGSGLRNKNTWSSTANIDWY